MNNDTISTKWEIISGINVNEVKRPPDWYTMNISPGVWTTYTFDCCLPKNRVVKKFVWKPIKLEKRWRWLCFVYILQTERFPYRVSNQEWININFMSYSEYLEWRLVNE